LIFFKYMPNLKKSIYFITGLVIVFGLSVSLQSLLAAWTAPTAAPPGNNVYKPIYASSSVDQVLEGGRGLGLTGPFSAPRAEISGWISGGTSDNGIYILGNGNVGVGTNNPVRQLHVSAPTLSSELILEVLDAQANSKRWNLYSATAGGVPNTPTSLYLRLLNDAGNGGPNVMTWLNNGNVGIGTSNPLNLANGNTINKSLEVNGWIIAVGNGNNSWGDPSARIGITTPGSSPINGQGKTWYMSANPDGNFAIHQGYGIPPGSVGGDRITIDSTGNVGIGTNNPSSKLDVRGEVKVGNSGATCSAAKAGSIRWTDTAFQGCNGTAWVSLGGG
jgi:hypothetical protein